MMHAALVFGIVCFLELLQDPAPVFGNTPRVDCRNAMTYPRIFSFLLPVTSPPSLRCHTKYLDIACFNGS